MADLMQVSHGMTVTGQNISLRTMLAASGSQWKLNSAAAVMLPSPETKIYKGK